MAQGHCEKDLGHRRLQKGAYMPRMSANKMGGRVEAEDLWEAAKLDIDCA